MSPVDEGLIHAWIEGQLPEAEAQRVAELVATDAAWEAAAAEARGLIAGTSRVLGALDHVASIGAVGSAHGARRASWRAPWLRAAAALVFFAGTATVVWQNMPGGSGDALSMAPVTAVAPPESKSIQPLDTVRRPEPEPARAVVLPPSTPPEVAGRVADASGPPGSAERAARQSKAVGGDDTVTVAANQLRQRVTGDSITGRRAIGGVVVAAPPVALVEQGVIGAVRRDQTIDARLAGCWARIDTTGTMTSFAVAGRAFAAAPSAIVAMRFIGPAITDLLLPADSARGARVGAGRGAGRGGGRAAGVASGSSALREAASERAAIIGPFNATTRMLPDSSYVAEFIDELGRSDLAFTVSGDTLRGAMRRSAGDVRYPAIELRAVRVVCPR